MKKLRNTKVKFYKKSIYLKKAFIVLNLLKTKRWVCVIDIMEELKISDSSARDWFKQASEVLPVRIDTDTSHGHGRPKLFMQLMK